MAKLTADTSEKKVFRINLRRLNSFLGLTLIAGATAYFITVNGLSTRGFEFKELKQKTNFLTAERQDLESEITALASYQNLNQRIAAARLVTSKEVAYVSWGSQMVAKK